MDTKYFKDDDYISEYAMSNEPRLGYYKLDPTVKDPVYATDGSACFDLHAHFLDPNYTIYLYPGGTVELPTRLIFSIPENYCLKIFSRSGQGFNENVCLVNSVGIIDSDYRDEVMVKLIKFNDESDPNNEFPYVIKHGDRIAQAMLVHAPKIDLKELKTKPKKLPSRKGGFGSTGK